MDAVLLEAKREYTEQVVSKLTRPLYDEMYTIWKQALQDEDKSPMRLFQDMLEEIVSMDEKDLMVITDRCIGKTNCTYFSDLIAAIFVAHTRVLLSIRNQSVTKDGYKLQVPTSNRFVKACVFRCAREFWKSPYLFYQNEHDNKITKVQVQKNLREAETIIAQAIRDTTRNLLPLKDVLDTAIERSDTGDIILEKEPELVMSAEPELEKDSSEPAKEPDTDKKPELDVSIESESKEDSSELDVSVESKSKEDSSEPAKEPDTDKKPELDVSIESELKEDSSEPAKEPDTDKEPELDVSIESESKEDSSDPPVDEVKEMIHAVQEPVQKDFPGWDSMQIEGIPDDDILIETTKDAIDLDAVTIDAEEL